MEIIGSLLVAAVPVVGIIGLLWLSERLRARREVGRRLQISVTDAVHGALGAVAAPVVTRRPGGGWRIQMRVPPGRSDLAAELVRVTEGVMERAAPAWGRPYEIVLLAAEGIGAAGRGSRLLGHHPKTAAPLTAGAR
jgi:hypothetical protein